ncbi:hypothetical protein DPMN_194105 [Dreissena polymorpha]|uniref:Uncharacterized protein n=1 Tax=Dreissena polymorpha TaxID=45954 RepID=A0A9D3Y4D7_DREPO|nr:hypothetical protein DPMN_194105 [Dreissena polymorpha]
MLFEWFITWRWLIFFRDLSQNRLRNISRATFRGLAKLRILDLSSNQLESIDDGSFEGMPDLYEL